MSQDAQVFFIAVTRPGSPLRAVVEASAEASVGREAVNTVHLAHPLVSRAHALLRILPGDRLEVTDLGSRNGTRVDGKAVTPVTVVPLPALVEIDPFILEVASTADEDTWTVPGQSGLRLPRTMLDRGTRQFSVEGRVALATLTSHEYAVLDLLSRQAPNVVDRSAVGDSVWGAGQWDVYMLHNLVSRIRKRIAQAGVDGAVIVTVPGVGYRLE